MALILGLSRLVPKFPVLLLTVAASIAAVTIFDLQEHGVKVVGVLPKGLPPFGLPHVAISDLATLLGGAAGIALVAVTDTISTSSAFAGKRGVQVRSNQEMIGIGAANLAAGLFHGFAVSTSGSRSAGTSIPRATSFRTPRMRGSRGDRRPVEDVHNAGRGRPRRHPRAPALR